VPAMTRRFSGEPDGAELERLFQQFCAELHAGAEGAVGWLVEWLAREMRARQWDVYGIP